MAALNDKITQKEYTDRIRIEEVFHMFTQWGYGLEWPKQFGTTGNNWNASTLTKECRKAKCVWWQHPENNCPDKKAISSKPIACTNKDLCKGTCARTDCDCVEWYHQVISRLPILKLLTTVVFNIWSCQSLIIRK